MVTYTDTGELCDCECVYRLSYRLRDVPEGTWTVTVPGQSGTVTME